MAFQREMTPSLKTKLDDIVETLKHDGFISREADISAISRENSSIENILNDIKNAIDARKALNKNLEQLSASARVHYKKAEVFQNEKNYQKALHEYSKSLCCFPYNLQNKSRCCQNDNMLSENDGIVINFEKKARRSPDTPFDQCGQQIAEAFAGRAEMLRYLGHHELALEDIEEALSQRPCQELRSSILQTHKLCLSEMRRQTRCQSPHRPPSVADVPHESIASASNLIKVNYEKNKGRYLEANGNIRAGDVLIVEKPYASVLLPEYYHSHCYHCLKLLVAPIPCFSCQDVLFCSKDCQSKSYSSYHNIECKIWPLIQMIDSFAHLSMRVLLTAKPDELLGALESERNADRGRSSIHGFTNIEYKHDYKAVYNLVTNSDLQSGTSISSNAVVSAIISRFLLGPEAAKSNEFRENFNMSSAEPKTPRLRLSSSSPAILAAKSFSSHNLNSLADAFANYDEKGSRSEHSTRSLNLNNNTESFRRSSIPIGIKKDPAVMAAKRRSLGCEDGLFLGFYQTVLNEEQITRLILRHIQQISCNVHTVTTLTLVENNEAAKQQETYGKQEVTLRMEQRQIALAVYPTSCLLNHACDPDVIVSFHDDELVVRATHNITKGEEITHCYVPHVGRMQRAARQRMLQSRYFFICSCAACRRDEERERRQLCSLKFLCPECRDVAKIDNSSKSYVVRCTNKDCGRTSNADSLLEEIQDSRELFMDAVDAFKLGNVRQSLSLLQKAMKKRSLVLNAKDKLVAEVHDALSRCYEVLREWEFASYHCSMNLDSLEHQHGKSSSECAQAVWKLAKCLYNGKLFDKADRVIDRGIKLLSLHYGEDYYALKELAKMKECVRNFSSPVGQFSL